ncbi:MAG TPA: PLP-dependent aminotransferase family protein, partial [Solirubrobacteraceae bacterium]|nr:PLP-dependent aminotransferase family protein [Solirubrobacteraceae bacterium]
LEAGMPAGTRWTNPDGGFFIWVTLPEGVRASTLAEQARARGVEFLPGTACHFSGGDGTLRLSYSFTDEEQIRRGIAILAELVRGELTPAG